MDKQDCNRVCEVADCERLVYAKKICQMHYNRKRERGSVHRTNAVNSGKTCKVDGCDKAAEKKHMCRTHYRRDLRHGSTEATVEWHGKSNSPLHRIWKQMRSRCNCQTHKGYDYWGGRGIRVCEMWDSFSAFAEDMGPRPSPAHSIDRIDNDGNYEASNCRWATPAEQAANKRDYKNNTSGTKGVYFRSRAKKWQVYIFTEGKRVCLGSFSNKEEAVAARLAAE